MKRFNSVSALWLFAWGHRTTSRLFPFCFGKTTQKVNSFTSIAMFIGVLHRWPLLLLQCFSARPHYLRIILRHRMQVFGSPVLTQADKLGQSDRPIFSYSEWGNSMLRPAAPLILHLISESCDWWILSDIFNRRAKASSFLMSLETYILWYYPTDFRSKSDIFGWNNLIQFGLETVSSSGAFIRKSDKRIDRFRIFIWIVVVTIRLGSSNTQFAVLIMFVVIIDELIARNISEKEWSELPSWFPHESVSSPFWSWRDISSFPNRIGFCSSS